MGLSRIFLTFLLFVGATTAGAEDDRWRGTQGVFEFGPSWRSSNIPARPEIPNTIGGQLGASLRQSLGSAVFVSAGAQLAVTTQTVARVNASIGDWSGTEYHPFVPGIGLRIGSAHLLVSYPMFGKLVLLSKTAGGEDVKYSRARFLQAAISFETAIGLFGVQYRKGTFGLESFGANAADLDPKLDISAFSILFGFSLF